MSKEWILALAPVIGLAVSVLVQVLVHFSAPRWPVVASYAVGTLSACLATAGIVAATSDGIFPWADQAVGLLTVLGLSFCYSNLVNIFYSSLRVRLLCRLAKAGGAMSEADFVNCYSSGDVVADRLARLVDWGQLKKDGPKYYSSAGWLLVLSTIYLAAKRLFLRRGYRFESGLVRSVADNQ